MPRRARGAHPNDWERIEPQEPEDEQDEQPILNPEHIPANEIFETPPMPEREVLLPVDPLYERQHSLGLHTPSVALVGCGGVGCWVALSLVLGGVTDLTLFDGDTLSVHNLNRFPLPEAAIGGLKSVALARWLRTLRPKAEIQARGEFDPNVHNPMVEWIVCATDSLKSRQMCHKLASGAGIKYLEVGADGERWGLSPSPPEFSTELEDSPGYSTVPVHVGPCMMAGAAAAYYVLHDTTPSGSHTMEWDKKVNLLAGRWISEDPGPAIDEETDPPDIEFENNLFNDDGENDLYTRAEYVAAVSRNATHLQYEEWVRTLVRAEIERNGPTREADNG